MSSNSYILRKFKDEDDLFDLIPSAQILEWINEFAEIKERYDRLDRADQKRAGYHKKYQETRKLLMSTVKGMLDPDELARINKIAEAKAAGREEEDNGE